MIEMLSVMYISFVLFSYIHLHKLFLLVLKVLEMIMLSCDFFFFFFWFLLKFSRVVGGSFSWRA